MRPSNIFIVRHGLSMSNIDGSIHATIPDWKIPLSTMGYCQSKYAGEQIANALSFSGPMGVYVSPFLRTRETWAAMKTRFPIDKIQFEKEDPRLREQEWGNLRADRSGPERNSIEDERDNFGPFFYRFLNGESGADVYDRCTMFLSTLYRDFDHDDFPDTVLIVTHGFTMRCLVMRWLHASVEEFHSWRNPPNCHIVKLIKNQNEKYELCGEMAKNEKV